MNFSKELQVNIMNEIATAFKIEQEKRIFFENVIFEREKIIKKPIFGESRPLRDSQLNASTLSELSKDDNISELKQEQEQSPTELTDPVEDKENDKKLFDLEKNNGNLLKNEG